MVSWLSDFMTALLALFPAASFIFAVWILDRRERETAITAAVAAAWGLAAGVFSILLGLEEIDFPGWLGSGSWLAVEAWKGTVLFAIFGLKRLESPSDGALYGLAAGAGYGFCGVVSGAYGSGFALWTPLAHGVSTGILGAALGAVRFQESKLRQITLGTLALGLAAAASLSWRRVAGSAAFPGSPAARIAAMSLPAVVALVLWFAAVAYESRILHRELTDESGLGLFPEDDIAIVPHFLRRIRTQWWPDGDGRRRFIALTTRLGFCKHRQRVMAETQRRLYQVEVLKLRERIQRLLLMRPPQFVDSGRGNPR